MHTVYRSEEAGSIMQTSWCPLTPKLVTETVQSAGPRCLLLHKECRFVTTMRNGNLIMHKFYKLWSCFLHNVRLLAFLSCV